MTGAAEQVSRSSADTQRAEELADRVREEGVELVGPAGVLAGLTKSVLEALLRAEMSEQPGYDKYDGSGRTERANSRNGTRFGEVLTDFGPIEIAVPRNGDGSFEPEILRRFQRRVKRVAETVISLAANGLISREVQAHLAKMYGAQMSPSAVSRITKRVIIEMSEWRDRPLDRTYPVVFIGAQDVRVRNGQVTNRPAYAVVGVGFDGTRELLGLWIGSGREGVQFWRKVLAQLRNRGVEDVSIVVCDPLAGLPQAIEGTWASAATKEQSDLAPVSAEPAFEDSALRDVAATLPAVTPSDTTEQRLADVLADVMGLEQVPVDSHFFDELGADSMVMTRFCARVRKHTDLPSISIKKIYEHPTLSSLAATLPAVTPSDTTEQRLADVLADVMGLEQVPVDSHFFDELGADSMVMTRFCARVRKHTDLPSISIKKIYEHPTLSSLAANGNGAPAPAPPSETSPAPVAEPGPTRTPAPVGTLSYVLCGTMQLLTLFGYSYLVFLAMATGYGWISAASGIIDTFLRAAAIGNGILLGTSIVPILMKWILIGRWKQQEFRVWGVKYFRFWVVKTLLRINPLALFAGSPIYVLYLRALGAKIGRGAVILSRHVPVCSDLLTIGDNTVVRKDSFFNCYRAHDGLIQMGPVRLGRDVYVGEMTVLDINTSMGDGAQLGHSSTLTAGQSIPAGEHRCGSPARERTDVDYRSVPPAAYGRLRRIVFSVAQLLNWLVLSSLVFGATIAVASFIDARLYFGAADVSPFSESAFYWDALLVSSVLLFGFILVGLVVVATVPRVLNLALMPDRVYPLYGPRYWIHRVIGRMTNVPLFLHLFGDSSYVVHYLRWLGYDLSEEVVQTGSNFGQAVKHDNPYLVSIGRGSMIADGLSLINADYSETSFRVSQVTIGAHNFLGNHVAYPSQGKTGANCLLATKVMVPIDGEVRTDVGLLGVPSFQIPRSVQRDIGINHPKGPEEVRRRLAAKNRHNLTTMGLFLLGEWVFSFSWILLTVAAANYTQTTSLNVFALAMPFTIVLRVLYQVLLERASTLFRRLRPRQCSIYEPYFWSHERYWKFMARTVNLPIFAGTPLKSVLWRIMGVGIGRRVFDDGCHIPERTLVTVGDHCTLNVGSVVQSHSQEDGAFKSDNIAIGAGCTLGTGSLVHYGVTIGDGAQLAAGAFLMKGEEVPPHTKWEGNPAVEVDDPTEVRAERISAEQKRLVGAAG